MSGFLHADYGSSTPTHNSHNSHTQFIFPVLKSAEVLQCMTELGIEVSKIELTEPHRHKEKVRKVFWQLLDICCGITEEDLQKESPSTDHLPHPDIHDDFTDMFFFRELRKCLATCGIYDFSLKDIHIPTAKRFRCQLSAIINMAKFREEQLKVYAELNEPRAQLLLTLEEIHKEHQQLNEQLQEAQAESNVQMEELDQVVTECEHLESEIARSNKEQASKRENAAALKREANDLKDELSSANWAFQETEAEEERLMSQVVSSPNRRKDELARKKERLEKEKQESGRLQDGIQQNKANAVVIQQSIKNVQETMQLQQKVVEEASKYEEAMGQVHETIKEVEENNEKSQELVEKADEAERGLLRVEEKLSHMRKQGKMKTDAAQDRLGTANSQLVQVEKERREGTARVEAGEAEVRALEAKMKEEQLKTDREITSLIAEYKETENVFMLRNERRMQIVEAAV
jgi:kinetochore protein Nuf2